MYDCANANDNDYVYTRLYAQFTNPIVHRQQASRGDVWHSVFVFSARSAIQIDWY